MMLTIKNPTSIVPLDLPPPHFLSDFMSSYYLFTLLVLTFHLYPRLCPKSCSHCIQIGIFPWLPIQRSQPSFLKHQKSRNPVFFHSLMYPYGPVQSLSHSRWSVKISTNDEWVNSPYIISCTPVASTTNFMMNPNSCLQLRFHFQAPDLYVSIWPLSITTWIAPSHLKLKISKTELSSSTSLLKPSPLPPPPPMLTISVNGVAPHSCKPESYLRLLSLTHSLTSHLQSITYPTYFSHLISYHAPSLSCQHWLPCFYTCCSFYLTISSPSQHSSFIPRSPFLQGSSHSAQCIQIPSTLIIALTYPSPTLDSEVLRSETMADCILVSNTASAAYYIFKTCLINKWMSKPNNIPGLSMLS